MCCTCPYGGNRLEFSGATIVDSDTEHPETNFHYAVPKDSETNGIPNKYNNKISYQIEELIKKVMIFIYLLLHI